MKTTVKTISLKMIIVFSAAAMMLAAVAAQAAMLVDRGLPTINLNNAAGANRSNVAIAEPASPDVTVFDGDTFTVQGTQTWKVDTISLWFVGYGANNNTNLTDDTYLGNYYNNLSLYVGTGGNLTRVSLASFSPGTDTTSNPDVVGTRVQYNGGVGTQLDESASWTIVQLDFNNLNLYFAPGTTVQFGMYATGSDITYTHASDAALSGSEQDQADGVFNRFVLDSPTAAHFLDAPNGQLLWGKPTDINVQVEGSVVPEPGTLMLLSLAGLIGLAMVWIRRRRFSG
jgi:hypothetical protein